MIESFITAPYEYTVTNVVSCRPPENRNPTEQEIELCRPKLEELVSAVPFNAVVYLGVIARSYETKLPHIYLLHPAAIVREEYRLASIKEQALKLSRFLEQQYALFDSIQEGADSNS